MNEKVLGIEPFFHPGSQISQSTFGVYTEIGPENYFENVAFGDFSYSGLHCFLQNTEVGKFVNIAAMVRVGPTNHPMERPTMHHFTYRRKLYGFSETDDADFFHQRQNKKTIIGHDVWLGHASIILPGVRVGDGAVVGSGTIVTKDVPPYAVVVGNPARVARLRFNEKEIDQLKNLQWWNWPVDVIQKRLDSFSLNINDFLELYSKEFV